jgi:hypothetical protein
MNFLKKSISTISNAVEINALKGEREDLYKENEELENKKKFYSEQVELKDINHNMKNHLENTLIYYRQLFIKNNINDYENEIIVSTDTNILTYKKLYDDLKKSISTIDEIKNLIDGNICNDISFYQNKIDENNKKIAKLNDKLKVVRDKQYG